MLNGKILSQLNRTKRPIQTFSIQQYQKLLIVPFQAIHVIRYHQDSGNNVTIARTQDNYFLWSFKKLSTAPIKRSAFKKKFSQFQFVALSSDRQLKDIIQDFRETPYLGKLYDQLQNQV